MENTKNGLKQTFLKNVFMLMLAQIIIKIMGLAYRVVMVNIPGFGDIGNGYYSSGYEIYAVLLTIVSTGIPVILTKMIAERVALKNISEANLVFKMALKLTLVLGITISILLYLFSKVISDRVFQIPKLDIILKILSPAIVCVGITSLLRSYFAGFSNLKVSSVVQTLEQFLNATLSIFLTCIFIGKDPYLMASGGVLATTISVMLSLIYLVIYFKKNKIQDNNLEKVRINRKKKKQILKTLIFSSIPITLATLISVLDMVIDTATISSGIQKAFSTILQSKELLANKAIELKGILSKVSTISALPISINIAIATAVLPEIASAKAKKDYAVINNKIELSLSLTFLIAFPALVGLFVMSDQIIALLFPNAIEGGLLLKLSVISTIFICILHTINGILQGLNKIIISSFAIFVAIIVKVVLNILLIPIPQINIYGAAIATIVCQFVAFLISIIALMKLKYIKIQYTSILKPIISSILMGFFALSIFNVLKIVLRQSLATLLTIILSIIMYCIILILIGGINREQLKVVPFGDKLLKIFSKFIK